MGRFYNIFFYIFYPSKDFEDAWSVIYENMTHLSLTAMTKQIWMN